MPLENDLIGQRRLADLPLAHRRRRSPLMELRESAAPRRFNDGAFFNGSRTLAAVGSARLSAKSSAATTKKRTATDMGLTKLWTGERLELRGRLTAKALAAAPMLWSERWRMIGLEQPTA